MVNAAGIAMALAAQGLLPPVAPGPVEVEIESSGTVDVAAQGYSVSAFFTTQQIPGGPAPSSAAVQTKAIAAANAIGPVTTPTCGGDVSKIGFIGNEAVGGPAPEETDAEEAPTPYRQYAATFATLEQARRAAGLLRAAGGTSTNQPQGVLFQCGAANLDATKAAIAASHTKALGYAALFNLKMVGMRRVSDQQSDTWGAVFARATQSGRVALSPDMVRVTATMTVTYILDR